MLSSSQPCIERKPADALDGKGNRLEGNVTSCCNSAYGGECDASLLSTTCNMISTNLLLQMSHDLLLSQSSLEEQGPHPPDLFMEDDYELGPRLLSTPIHPDTQLADDISVLSAAAMFNKGLVYHAKEMFIEAKRHYQTVVYLVQNLLCTRGASPCITLLEIGMRVNNNLGLLNFADCCEEHATSSFEASLIFANSLVNMNKRYCHEYATVVSNWCRMQWMDGDLSDNLYLNLKEVLRIRSYVHGFDHQDVGAAHFNIGLIDYTRQRKDSAQFHFRHYLRICSLHRGRGSSELDPIPALVYLLLMKHEDKEDNMAQELVRGLRTLQDKRQEHGSTSFEVASVMNFVGTLLFHREDFENALQFFQEELHLEEALSKVNTDVSVSVTCNNIGRILQEMGKYREAISYYYRALKADYGDVSEILSSKGCQAADIGERALKAASPTSANLYSTVWYNLGLIHDKLGSYADAIRAFQMALVLRKAMLGIDHPDIACLLYNIGVLQMEQQQLDAASLSFREALRIRRVGVSGQLNDRHVLKTLEKLASLHKSDGNITAALEVHHEILSIQEVSLEFDPLVRTKDAGVNLRSIAELHHALGDLPRSIKTARESVLKLEFVARSTLIDSISTPEHIAHTEQWVASLLLLGSLYHETSEPIQATQMFNDAAAILRQQMSPFGCPTSLVALREVTHMLATSHCAPLA